MTGSLRNASVGVLHSWSAATPLAWFAGLADALARVKELNAAGWFGTIEMAHLYAGPPSGPEVYLRLIDVLTPLDDLLAGLEPLVAEMFALTA